MRVRKLALAAAIVVSGIARHASADQPGSDWMTKEQVMQKLSAAGYSNVTGLEADDGHWEGKGTKNGKIMEFHVDPHSGALTKEEVDD
jgi:predicted aspartyl protease